MPASCGNPRDMESPEMEILTLHKPGCRGFTKAK